jgi:hypothetical protein
VNAGNATFSDIVEGLFRPGAACLDVAACYNHYPLPKEVRNYYSFYFQHHDTSLSGWYGVTTIPTGSRHCPALAQTILMALTNEAIKRYGGAQRCDCYIDNVRICGSEEEVATTMNGLLALARRHLFLFNVESHFSTRYSFLGVECQHLTSELAPSTKAMEKALTKLRLTADRALDDQATYGDGLALLGILIWISRITLVDMANFYGPLKCFRRRASAMTPMYAPLKLWPSVRPDLLTWIRTAYSNVPRLYRRRDDEPHTVVAYTDASMEGYGAVIFMTDIRETDHYNRHYSGGPTRLYLHINRIST